MTAPRDKNGNELQVGDEVMGRFKIVGICEGSIFLTDVMDECNYYRPLRTDPRFTEKVMKEK